MKHIVYFNGLRIRFERVGGKDMASPVAKAIEATLFDDETTARRTAIAHFGPSLANVKIIPQTLPPATSAGKPQKQTTLL